MSEDQDPDRKTIRVRLAVLGFQDQKLPGVQVGVAKQHRSAGKEVECVLSFCDHGGEQAQILQKENQRTMEFLALWLKGR